MVVANNLQRNINGIEVVTTPGVAASAPQGNKGSCGCDGSSSVPIEEPIVVDVKIFKEDDGDIVIEQVLSGEATYKITYNMDKDMDGYDEVEKTLKTDLVALELQIKILGLQDLTAAEKNLVEELEKVEEANNATNLELALKSDDVTLSALTTMFTIHGQHVNAKLFEAFTKRQNELKQIQSDLTALFREEVEAGYISKDDIIEILEEGKYSKVDEVKQEIIARCVASTEANAAMEKEIEEANVWHWKYKSAAEELNVEFVKTKLPGLSDMVERILTFGDAATQKKWKNMVLSHLDDGKDIFLKKMQKQLEKLYSSWHGDEEGKMLAQIFVDGKRSLTFEQFMPQFKAEVKKMETTMENAKLNIFSEEWWSAEGWVYRGNRVFEIITSEDFWETYRTTLMDISTLMNTCFSYINMKLNLLQLLKQMKEE